MTEPIKKAILDILEKTPEKHIRLDTSDIDGKCGTNDDLVLEAIKICLLKLKINDCSKTGEKR